MSIEINYESALARMTHHFLNLKVVYLLSRTSPSLMLK